MINEGRALELLAEANPVPDLASYEISEADIAARLATLQQRSSEMTELNTRTEAPIKSPTRFWWALAGGLAIAVAATMTFITLTGDDTNNAADDDGLTSAEFVGTWTSPQQGVTALFIYFGENGRYALSDSFGAFEDRIIESGDWTFDGEEFVFMTDNDSSTCAGTVGRYKARRVDDERIRLTPATPDSCAERQEGIALGAYLSYPLDPEFSNQ